MSSHSSKEKRATDFMQVVEGSRNCDHAVIAFGGIQSNLGGIEFWEFATTLLTGTSQQPKHPPEVTQRHVAFVRESPPHWYNNTEQLPLEQFVTSQIAERRLISTLGNSMGGYAAILYSLLLPNIRRSISFCPQYSVRPEYCPFETRWQEKIGAIASWRFDTCLPLSSNHPRQDLTHFIICGTDVSEDVRHAEMIVAKAANPAIAIMIAGCGHEVARHLKSSYTLTPLLDLLFGKWTDQVSIGNFMKERNVQCEFVTNRN